MQEKVKEIAARVKELRELSEISVAEMAACIQSSEEYYRSYEAGNEDISASRLYEIAQKLFMRGAFPVSSSDRSTWSFWAIS